MSNLISLPKDVLNEILGNLPGEDIVNLMTTSQQMYANVLQETYDYLQYIKKYARPAEQRDVNRIQRCIESYDINDMLVVERPAAKILNIPDFMKAKSERLTESYYIYSKRALILWTRIYAVVNKLNMHDGGIYVDENLDVLYTIQHVGSVMSIQDIYNYIENRSVSSRFFINTSVIDPIMKPKHDQFLCQEYSDLKALAQQLNIFI